MQVNNKVGSEQKQKYGWLREARTRNSRLESRCRDAMQAISTAFISNKENSMIENSLLEAHFISPESIESQTKNEKYDFEVTQRARKLQHDLRVQEIKELVWEAEHTAEAGDEKFVGIVTKFVLMKQLQ